MPRTRLYLAIAAMIAVLAACAAASFSVVAPMLPATHANARQRWQQEGIRHYEVEASWASDWNFGHVRAEVRDNLVVGGLNLDTGTPLTPNERVRAGYFVSIDELYRMIGQQMRPSPDLRYQVARYHPLLAQWLDPCAAILPRVTYDTQFSYPTGINYRGTPCFNGANVYLKITSFKPLP